MPLPPALLARLARRGIVKKEEQSSKAENEEEVFAEDYDDPLTKVDEAPDPIADPLLDAVDENKELVFEVSACPNKSNPYHSCVEYCGTRWGKKDFISDPETDKRRQRMLRKYPLPEGWNEVGEPETGRYYYWCYETDQVSWLSPLHPKAQITYSANIMQEATPAVADTKSDSDTDVEAENDVDPVKAGLQKEKELNDAMSLLEKMEKEREAAGISESDSLSSSESEDEEEQEKRKARERDIREREKRGRGRGRDTRNREPQGKGRKEKEALDPMDPAAYSDVPRGGWNTGLESRAEAKTGVDSTVAGPLFQQRPYPSPGDVLRANRQAAGEKT